MGNWHCVRVSPGCQSCYAERLNVRLGGPAYRVGADTIRLDQKLLADPLTWRKPRMVFCCSMTDLFLEQVTNEQIAAIFGVMAACPQHCFQCLTKRPQRMKEWFAWVTSQDRDPRWVLADAATQAGVAARWTEHPPAVWQWPLPGVWIGVSCEDQKRADERIPILLQVPAAVRWISYEPALEAVDFSAHLAGGQISWVVGGGESGPNSRACDVEWLRSMVRQCRAVGCRAFVKQLGRRPYQSPRYDVGTGYELRLKHPKGEDPAEFPEDLRVREWPSTPERTRPGELELH